MDKNFSDPGDFAPGPAPEAVSLDPLGAPPQTPVISSRSAFVMVRLSLWQIWIRFCCVARNVVGLLIDRDRTLTPRRSIQALVTPWVFCSWLLWMCFWSGIYQGRLRRRTGIGGDPGDLNMSRLVSLQDLRRDFGKSNAWTCLTSSRFLFANSVNS